MYSLAFFLFHLLSPSLLLSLSSLPNFTICHFSLSHLKSTPSPDTRFTFLKTSAVHLIEVAFGLFFPLHSPNQLKCHGYFFFFHSLPLSPRSSSSSFSTLSLSLSLFLTHKVCLLLHSRTYIEPESTLSQIHIHTSVTLTE